MTRTRAYSLWWGLRVWHTMLLVLLLSLASQGVAAVGFQVLRASTELRDGVYWLDARIEYNFSSATLDALENGVPLTLQLQAQVVEQRGWLWDRSVADIQLEFRLEYHALTRQYLVTNLNSGELQSFPSRSAAATFLGRIDNFPLLDNPLLDREQRYYGRLRASLDIESLPAPLRPVAYLSAAWRLTSEWYQWPL